MFKKALVVFTLLVSLIVFSHAAQATSYGEPDGFYWLYGTTKLSAKFTGIATVSVTLSDLSVFGSLFYFDPWGDFAFYLPFSQRNRSSGERGIRLHRGNLPLKATWIPWPAC